MPQPSGMSGSAASCFVHNSTTGWGELESRAIVDPFSGCDEPPRALTLGHGDRWERLAPERIADLGGAARPRARGYRSVGARAYAPPFLSAPWNERNG